MKMGDMLLTDLVKTQTDVNVSEHSPLGLQTEFKMWPKRDHATFWWEQESRVRFVETRTRRQNRTSRARPGLTKTFGEDGEGGELNLQAG